jgi:hypothetical protein
MVIALIAVMIAPASAGSQTAAAGGIGVRLLDVPVAMRNDPRAQLYIVDHLAPGTIIHRRIEISNNTQAPVRIALYPAAAAIARGTFLGAAGHTSNDLSTWTSILPNTSDVPARGHVIATVTISVPSDAAPGEQYGVVWAEARSTPSHDRGVVQVSRVGIRLYLSVGAGGPPAANFAIDSLTAMRSQDGEPMVLASVHNTGGRALDMNGTLELSNGPGGLSAGPFPATLGVTLAIGDTETVTITLNNQIPAGPWDSRITLRSGLLERTAQATLTFPAAGAAAPEITIPTRPGWLYPVGTILLVLLLGIATLIMLKRQVGHAPASS